MNIPPRSKLEIYISPTCPYCADAMSYYDDLGTNYVTYDAQNDLNERARMLDYSGGDPTVPVIVADGKYVQSGWGSPPRG